MFEKMFERLRTALHPLTLVSLAARLTAEADALRRVAEEERARADALERRLESPKVRARWCGNTVYNEQGQVLGSYYYDPASCSGTAYWNVPFDTQKILPIATVREAVEAVERGLSPWCAVEPEEGGERGGE